MSRARTPSSLAEWARRFGPRFERHVPRRIDDAWLTRFVDVPRFGWDLPGLHAGFTQPLYRFVDALPPADASVRPHTRHLRAGFACALMSALPGAPEDPLRYELELTALELHALASTLLDHLDNGQDLAASQGRERECALPVLITVAYSARQLAASMLWTHGRLAAPRRERVAQRFARLLMLQGVGHTLDLWGAQARLVHEDASALEDHLRWMLTPLDFELVAELAAAAAELPAQATEMLVQSAGDLGLAWHATRALAEADHPGARTPEQAPSQILRWKMLARGTPREALQPMAQRARERALARAGEVSGAAAALFDQFLSETLAGALEAAQEERA